MTISEDCFAPFDLSKTRKFDRKKDQESLRKSFYKLGVQYFEVSCFTIKNLNWIEPLFLALSAHLVYTVVIVPLFVTCDCVTSFLCQA